MSSAFRFQNVSKRFRNQLALDRVSLDGPRGAVIALLGENGAGKTTALRILLGLTEADSGKAEVLGLDSRTLGEEIRRRVGYVADRPSLYEWMTVGEIGWFAAGFYPAGYLAEYQRLIQRFELPLDRRVKALSKGMRAKVVLSLAMAHEPELLVLDEPTSGLDSMVRREFLESMVDVAATGRTVLLSSHQIGEVERVADWVAILRHGRLVLFEAIDELKRDVREVVLTLEDAREEPPAVSGTVIHSERRERQHRLLVRGLDEARLQIAASAGAVAHVETRRPSLEEIFVGYMQPEGAMDSSGAAGEPLARGPRA